jgi:preprotein translocase subunit SecA
MTGFFDRFSKRYDRVQREKKRAPDVVSPDDPPLPDTPVDQAHRRQDSGRNDPCPCGSGKKYKKCCGKAS